MAREKRTKEVKQESLESVLWESANKLRGGVPPYDYMNVVLGLVFLKYLSDRFEVRRENLLLMERVLKTIEMPMRKI